MQKNYSELIGESPIPTCFNIVKIFICELVIFATELSFLSPLPGTWGAWGMYSDCSKTCGSGVMTRTRTCITTNVTNSSETTNGTCVGESVNNAICLISLCSAGK